MSAWNITTEEEKKWAEDARRRWRGKKILIIGAAGAVGKGLAAEVLNVLGDNSVIAALRRSPLPKKLAIGEGYAQRTGVKQRGAESLVWVSGTHGASEDLCIRDYSYDASSQPELPPDLVDPRRVLGPASRCTYIDDNVRIERGVGDKEATCLIFSRLADDSILDLL